MAAKKAVGILSKPPNNKQEIAKLAAIAAPTARQQTRLNFLQKKTGAKVTAAPVVSQTPVPQGPAAPAPVDPGAPAAPQELPYLTPGQNELIDQTQRGDTQLGEYANQQLPNIGQSYSQPFDWGALPAAPVQGDYQGWVDKQMGNYNQAYDQRMDPVFKREGEDFDQQMANRGIPMGSPLYNQQKQLLDQSHNDARTQAYAAGQGQAVQSAGQLFDVGTQARGNAYSDAMAKRGMPLAEYNALMASQSPMGLQNLGYSQQAQMQGAGFGQQNTMQAAEFGQQNLMQGTDFANQLRLQNDAQKEGRWMMQHTPRGGGGGGGGAGPMWQQYGFSSPMEFDAYKTAQARDQQMWQWQNTPKGPQGPSYGAQIAGGLLGTAGMIGAGYLAGQYF